MDKKAIVDLARDRMSLAVDGDRQNRLDALDDLKYLAGDQWPQEVREAYEDEDRPVLTINRLPRFVRQVTGDIRKLNPAIKVLASDSAASDETAEIFAGLIRQIEQKSDASSIYEMAAESAAQCGIGNFRVLTDYESETSFDQVIRIESIPNPMAVYWDPDARMSTRAEAMFCFITDQMDPDDFAKEYPKASLVDVEFDGNTDGLENWHQGGNIFIAEYFWKEAVDKTIGLLVNGQITEDKEELKFATKKRQVRTYKTMWAKVSGKDVLGGPTELPTKYIPVISVTGEEMNIGERVARTSVIRFAKEPQQIYNYYASSQAEVIALQPKSPFLVTGKQIAGLEAFWNSANQGNKPYLPYNPDEKAGPPQRIAPPIMSQALSAEMQRAEDDMKATTGIYDAALGGRSNEQSGIAIRQRQLESDISTSIYTDNLAKAIEQCGRVLVDMIPKVYDTQRVLRLIGEDEQETQETVNEPVFDLDEGREVISNDLTRGAYDVRVTVGPNYTTRRQETAESMMQFVQAFPPAAQVAGDLIASAMDWPEADKIAKRLKKMLPEGIIPPDEMDEEQVNQQLQAMQQQMQQLMQQMQAMQQAPEMRKAQAEATEAEAQAEEASYDAMLKQLEVSATSGELQSVIQQAVSQALMASVQRGMIPQQ